MVYTLLFTDFNVSVQKQISGLIIYINILNVIHLITIDLLLCFSIYRVQELIVMTSSLCYVLYQNPLVYLLSSANEIQYKAVPQETKAIVMPLLRGATKSISIIPRKKGILGMFINNIILGAWVVHLVEHRLPILAQVTIRGP